MYRHCNFVGLLLLALAVLSNLAVGCALEPNLRVVLVHDGQIMEITSQATTTHPTPRLPPGVPECLPKSLSTFSIRADSKIAYSDRTFAAFLTSLEQPSPTEPLSQDTLAVAWSEDGQRLALLRSPEGSDWREALLEIRDADGRQVAWSTKVSITKPRPADVSGRYGWDLRLSWSTDGEYIAVSTSCASGRGKGFPQECAIVRLKDGKQEHLFSASDACFIGARRLAVHECDWSFGSIVVYDLEARSSGDMQFVRGWSKSRAVVLAGNAQARRLAIWVPGLGPIPDCYNHDGQVLILDQDGHLKWMSGFLDSPDACQIVAQP